MKSTSMILTFYLLGLSVVLGKTASSSRIQHVAFLPTSPIPAAESKRMFYNSNINSIQQNHFTMETNEIVIKFSNSFESRQCSEQFDFRDNENAIVQKVDCNVCFEDIDNGVMILKILNNAIQKPVRLGLKESGHNVEIQSLDDTFDVVKVVERMSSSFWIQFTDRVHVVRNSFGGIQSSISIYCREIFEASGDEECTLSFHDKLVRVDLKNSAVPKNIEFIKQRPAFFSVEDKFGLKPPIETVFNVRPRPFLLNSTHLRDIEHFGSVLLQFNEPLRRMDTERIICSDILELQNSNFSTELFKNRPEIFCSLLFDQNDPTRVIVGFPDVFPFFPFEDNTTHFFFQFVNSKYFVSEDGLSHATNKQDNLVLFESDRIIYDSMEFSLTGPTTTLSGCDTEFILEVTQIAGVKILFEITVEQDFCTVFSSTVICNTELFKDSNVSMVFDFDFGIDMLFFPGDDSLKVKDISRTPLISVVQDFSVRAIPLQVYGVDLSIPVEVAVKTPLSFTAVVGDLFACSIDTMVKNISVVWRIFDEDKFETAKCNSKICNIGADILEVGKYNVELTAIGNEKLGLEDAFISFLLFVEPLDVVLISSTGSEITVNLKAEDTVVLNAIRSCNVNTVDNCIPGLGLIDVDIELLLNRTKKEQITALGLQDYNLSWVCVECGGLTDDIVFKGVDRQFPILEIPLSNLEGLNLDQGNRILQESTSIDILEFEFRAIDSNNQIFSIDVEVYLVDPIQTCVLPKLEIFPVGPLLNADNAVNIVSRMVNAADFNRTENVDFFWSEAVIDGIEVLQELKTSARSRPTLFIPSGRLSEGAVYTFTVTASVACAEDVQVSTSVSFLTNSRPFGGVLQVSPTSGDVLTDFTISTAGWIDEEGDLPLQYAFEVFYAPTESLDDIDEISAQFTTPLSQFSQSPFITTNLQVAPENTTAVILAIAKDSRGATSRRLLSTSKVGVEVLNPFEEGINIDTINSLIDDLKGAGESARIPVFSSAVSSALNALSKEILDKNDTFTQAVELREILLGEISNLVNFGSESILVDPDFVNMMAQAISSITSRIDQLSIEQLQKISEIISRLVAQMNEEVDDAIRGANDPSASQIIPDSFRQAIIETVSNILHVVELRSNGNFTNGSLLQRARFLLDSEDEICSLKESSRRNVEDLGILQTRVLVPGAPQVDAEGDIVSLAALKDDSEFIGEFTEEIVILDIEGENKIILPNDTFSEELKAVNEGYTGDISIVAAKYKIQLYCERFADSLSDYDCKSTDSEYEGPLEGGDGNIIALDFFVVEDSIKSTLKVEELSDPLVLFLDLPPPLEEIEDFIYFNETCTETLATESKDSEVILLTPIYNDTLGCGFFDEQEKDYVTNVCTATLIDNKVKCECPHASDFAAFNFADHGVGLAFKCQFQFTKVVKLTLGITIPILSLLIGLLVLWSRKKDKSDAYKIVDGTAASIVLTFAANSYRKRVFFENAKNARIEMLLAVHDKKLLRKKNKKEKKSFHSDIEVEVTDAVKFPLLQKIFWTLKYEHSLFGLLRFDPHISRFKRSIIFIGVIISTFGVTALFFDTREWNERQNDKQIWVSFLISVLCALLSTVPIKLFVKICFRSTESALASSSDQVIALSMILHRLLYADRRASKEDVNYVTAISSYRMHQKESARTYRTFRGSSALSSAFSAHRKGSRKFSYGDTADVLDFESQYPSGREIFKSSISSKLILDSSSRRILNSSRRNLLFNQMKESGMNWRQRMKSSRSVNMLYSTDTKIRLVQRQKGLLKLCAIASGTPRQQAKIRKSFLPTSFTGIIWVFLLVIIGWFLAYNILFIGTRYDAAVGTRQSNAETDQVGCGTKSKPISEAELQKHSYQLSEQEYYFEWIRFSLTSVFISYCIAEPLISLTEYVFFPFLIRKFGNKSVNTIVATRAEDKLDAVSVESNYLDDYSQDCFSGLSEIMENVF